MNKLLIIFLLISGLQITDAQIFSRDSVRGATLGGLLGGIIGHNSNRRTAEGIGIGAASGWLLGSVSRAHRERDSYDTYIPSRHQSVYVDSAPSFRTSRRPNYAVVGAATGALAGSIIGHNQNRRTMEGLGIGAATGLVLGGVAEHAARNRERRHYFAEEAHPTDRVIYHQTPVATTQPVVVYQQPVVTVSQPRVVYHQQATTKTRPVTVQTTTTRPGRKSVFKRVSSSKTSHPVPAAQPVVINNYYITNNHFPATNTVAAKK